MIPNLLAHALGFDADKRPCFACFRASDAAIALFHFEKQISTNCVVSQSTKEQVLMGKKDIRLQDLILSLSVEKFQHTMLRITDIKVAPVSKE